jgi:signal transduction histidine kinase/uncharacterized membrane protein
MGQALSAIFNILTNFPGELIYYLVISLALILIIVLASPKVNHSILGHRARHVLIGSGILLILQIILFSISISFGQQKNEIPLFMGIIERAVNGLTIIWLMWTFIESSQKVLFTGVLAFISLLVIILGGISLSLAMFDIGLMQIENSLFLTLWQSVLIFLDLSGIILLLIKQPQHWGIGISILILLAVGYLLQLGGESPSILMGAVRLVQIFSFPWLIALVQRFADNNEKFYLPECQPELNPKQVKKDTKPELIDLLLKINLTKTSQEKYEAVARAISLSVVADICYILHRPGESQGLNILAGYDLIREEFLDTARLKQEQLPKITSAWEENQHLALRQPDAEDQDIETLLLLLNYHSVGNLFAYPLSLPENGAIAGVVFLSPYTNKQWTSKTRRQMDEIRETLTQVLFTKDPKEALQAKINQLQSELSRQKDQKEEIKEALMEKEIQINELKSNLKQYKGKYQKEKLQVVKQIDAMKKRIQDLREQTAIQSEEQRQLEQTKQKLRHLINERDQLKSALDRANARIKDLETQAGQTGPIRLATEKQIISLDSIAANVKMLVNQQLLEKNLNLELINPDGRQMIKTDPELLQRVLQELLQNAILASDAGEKIQLSQKVTYETGMLLLEVTDYGEGLTPEEQKELFSADHESIPGIGSVSAIRNAVQAIRGLNGKIWLRSKKGHPTTFRVQLPIRIID